MHAPAVDLQDSDIIVVGVREDNLLHCYDLSADKVEEVCCTLRVIQKVPIPDMCTVAVKPNKVQTPFKTRFTIVQTSFQTRL